jgi:hypothetical protein
MLCSRWCLTEEWLITLFITTSDFYEQECQRNLSNTHGITRTDRMERLKTEHKPQGQEILVAVRKKYRRTTARCWFRNRLSLILYYDYNHHRHHDYDHEHLSNSFEDMKWYKNVFFYRLPQHHSSRDVVADAGVLCHKAVCLSTR